MSPDPLSELRRFYTEREIDYTIVRSPEDLSSGKDRPIHYLFAGNGVFVAAKNEVFTVRKQMSSCVIKGLLPVEECFELHIPKVPADLLIELIRQATRYAKQSRTPHECMFYIFYSPTEDRFEMVEPSQTRTPTNVYYQVLPDRQGDALKVMDSHSHHCGPAYFSSTDRSSSAGLGLYGVVGCLNTVPRLALKVGIYGALFSLAPDAVFDISRVWADQLTTPEGLPRD